MTASLATSKTVRLSRRLSVTITVSMAGMTCEWNPELPEQMTTKELARYRKARDELVASLGVPAVVVEI
jgi:hypothetical protein